MKTAEPAKKGRVRKRTSPPIKSKAPDYETGADKAAVAEAPAERWETPRRVISATEAARRFSDLINRVGYKGETYVVERGGRAMCELSPIDVTRFTGDDFLELLRSLPRPTDEFLDLVEDASRHQAPVAASPWGK